MIEQLTRTDGPDYLPRTVGRAARLASAAAGGVSCGVLTLWMQGRLNGNWEVLGNSGAVWTVVAVALAALLGRSAAGSAVAGLLALLGEVAGYYWCAAPWHGIAVT